MPSRQWTRRATGVRRRHGARRWKRAKMTAMDRIYRVSQSGEPFYALERDGVLRRIVLRDGDLFNGYEPGAAVAGGLAAAAILAPVVPRKIVCVSLNYKDHAAEVGKQLPPEPLLFFKPSTAVID